MGPFSKEGTMAEREFVIAHPGAKVETSSKRGQRVIPYKPVVPSQRGSGVIDLDEEAKWGKLDETVSGEIDKYKFPGAEERHNQINWIGRSYSGADMKVVAHLYKPTDNDEEEAIERDKSIAKGISDDCNNLVTGGLTSFAIANDPAWLSIERQASFLAFAGLKGLGLGFEAKVKVENFIIRNVYAGANWNSYLGIAKVKNKALLIYESQKALAQAMLDRLDIIKKIEDKGQQTVVLASLQTLSVQSHREKFAVRALGHSYVKGYTRGPRTIAGSMIFTVFNEHALAGLIRSLGASSIHSGEKDAFLHTLLPDQLPPLDLTIAFANEYGSVSSLRLMGVEFINDGATYSIEDLLTENIINFVARDADPMTSHGNIKLHRNQMGLADEYKDLSGSQLLFNDNNYKEYITRLGFRKRLVNR